MSDIALMLQENNGRIFCQEPPLLLHEHGSSVAEEVRSIYESNDEQLILEVCHLLVYNEAIMSYTWNTQRWRAVVFLDASYKSNALEIGTHLMLFSTVQYIHTAPGEFTHEFEK